MCQCDNEIALLFTSQTSREIATHIGHAPVFEVGGPRGNSCYPFPVLGVSVKGGISTVTADVLFYEADDTNTNPFTLEYLVLLEGFWNL